jgi:hypothetical protein
VLVDAREIRMPTGNGWSTIPRFDLPVLTPLAIDPAPVSSFPISA